MDSFRPHLAKVAGGLALDRAEARAAFDDLLSGEVTPVQAGAFLVAMKVLPPRFQGLVKVLAGGDIETPFSVKGLKLSKEAGEKIEKAGGKISK